MNEPIEHHLARIEAMGELLAELEPCIHCHQRIEGHGNSEGAALPRAVVVVHEEDCPVELEFINAPAVEYSIDDAGWVQ